MGKGETGKAVKVVQEGTILPARYFSVVFDWGIGGVLDENGEFVEESGMEVMHRFGGKYEYDEQECEYLDETVIYLGPMMTHWGHFLAECSVRFWYLLENQEDYRVAFCGFWYGEGELSLKLTDIFGLLGVGKERLLDIRRPVKFKRILIPSPALEYASCELAAGNLEDFLVNWGEHNRRWSYTAGFRKTFQSITRKAEKEQYKTAEKIYYTRTGMRFRNEIGEDLIKKIFSKNGYMIVSPERESVEMQIALMHSCKRFVSLEGTLAHNIVFAGEDLKQTILWKKKVENALQPHLNQCMGVETESIYIGCRPFGRRFPRGGSDGIYWLRPGRMLKKWCHENDMWFPGPLEIFVADLKNLFAYIRLCGEEMRGSVKMRKEDSRVLKRAKSCKKIVLYGVNPRCLRWKHKIERKYPQKQIYWADTNDKAIQKYIKVYSMDDVADMKECVCFIGITDRVAAEEVKRKMLKKGMEEKAVYLFHGGV